MTIEIERIMNFAELISALQQLSPHQMLLLTTAVSLLERNPAQEIKEDLLLIRREIHDSLRQDIRLGFNNINANSETK